MSDVFWASILILVRLASPSADPAIRGLSVGPACRVCDQLEPEVRGPLTETYDAVYAPLRWACEQSDMIGGIVLLYIDWWMTIGKPRDHIDAFLIGPPPALTPMQILIGT